jgi:polar amino acid transport system substrate-binding protein
MKKQMLFLFLFLACSTFAMAADKDLTLVTLDWQPYSGQQLKNKGFTLEIVAAAFKKVGYNVKYVFNNDWEDAYKKLDKGMYDGMCPEYYTKAKESTLLFSDFFSESLLTLAFNKGLNLKYAGVKDLIPYRLGVVKGYFNTPEIDSATNLKKVIAATDEENLNNLITKKVDVIVIDRLVAQYFFDTKYQKSKLLIGFIDKPLMIHPLFVLFPKSLKESGQRVKDFNRGLEEIKKDGTYKAIMKASGYM